MVIVGILAAVAMPIMQGIKKKAIVTEALMGLGRIRQAEREYRIERADYVSDDFASPNGPLRTNGNITLGDLQGTYFGPRAYRAIRLSAASFLIICRPGSFWNPAGGAPQAAEANRLLDPNNRGYYILMDQRGRITSTIPGVGPFQ